MLYKKRAYEEKPVDSTQQAVPNKVTFFISTVPSSFTILVIQTFTIHIFRLESTRAEATASTRSHPREEVSSIFRRMHIRNIFSIIFLLRKNCYND